MSCHVEVFADATQRHAEAFPGVREGARTACIVTGSGSRRRRHGMLCRLVVFWNPIHRVALPPCRKSGPRPGVGFQGYPEVGVTLGAFPELQQPLTGSVQRFFSLGKVQAKLVVTGFGEEARAWHACHANGAAEPVGAFLIFAKA